MARAKSRAKRRDEASGELRRAAEIARALADTIRSEVEVVEEEDENEVTAPMTIAESTREAWQAQLDDASGKAADALSEYESLHEEMESWRENIEEKFSQTDKYNRVEEAAQVMETAKDADLDWPTPPEGDGATSPGLWEEFANELEDVAQGCEDAADEADGADFPGMFG